MTDEPDPANEDETPDSSGWAGMNLPVEEIERRRREAGR